MALHSVPYCGRVVKGVILDESHGRPVGTIALYGEDRKFVSKDGHKPKLVRHSWGNTEHCSGNAPARHSWYDIVVGYSCMKFLWDTLVKTKNMNEKSAFVMQDGELMKTEDAIDDEEMDNTWKAMQSQTGVKGLSRIFWGTLGVLRMSCELLNDATTDLISITRFKTNTCYSNTCGLKEV